MKFPFFYGWVIVAIAFVTMGIGVNARTAFSLLYPPILAEMDWNRGVTAGIFSFGFLVSAVLSPLLGKMMDSIGPIVVIEVGVGMIAIGFLLASFTSEQWQLYLSLGVLVGGGSVCVGFSGQSLFLPNWFERKRGLAIGIAFSGVGIGSIILLPVIQLFIERFGWRTTCVIMSGIVLVILAPINLFLRKTPQDIGLYPDGSSDVASRDYNQRNVRDIAWTNEEWTLRRAIRTTRFWWIAIGYFCGLFTWYAIQVHQTKYLIEIGFSSSAAAWALGLVGFAAIPGQIGLGHLSDRIGREWVWFIGCGGFAVCSALLIALKIYPWTSLLWAMIISQGAIGYGLASVFGPIIADVFHGKHYGSIFGTIMVVAIGGSATGPLLAGILYDSQGSYTLAFSICIVASVISAAAIWRAAPGKVRSVAR